jgi:CRP-like cAMP-binding protein
MQSKALPRNEWLSQLLSVPSIKSELPSKLTVVPVTENQVLYEQGERIEFVYFPLNSVISGVSITEDGSAIETWMVGCEGLAGITSILNSEVSQQWIWVTIGGSAIQMETRLIGKLLANNQVALESFFKYYELLLTQVAQRCVCNTRHTIMERLCCWLLMTHDRIGPRSLRLTQEVMASRIGARRAGITVAARTLQAINAIDYRRGRLEICSRNILEQMACECYKVVAVRFEPHYVSATYESANDGRDLSLIEKTPNAPLNHIF